MSQKVNDLVENMMIFFTTKEMTYHRGQGGKFVGRALC